MKSITTTSVLALIASSDAFAPSSFTPASSVKSSMRHVNNGSALQMNLFDRFSRVAKAGLNDVLKKVEDPEKILNQAVEDMQVSIIRNEKELNYSVCVVHGIK
jgi:hypothetical protein